MNTHDSLAELKPEHAAKAPATQMAAHASQATLDGLEILRRRWWLVASCTSLGLLLAMIYWANARIWYETRAKMLVTLKDVSVTQPGSTSWGEDRIQDEILANHMEIVRSRRIVGAALERGGYLNLPSVQAMLNEDTDAIDYVAKSLVLTKGGEGSARDARILNIALRHTNPEDALNILQAIVTEYETFLGEQVTRIMSEANELIQSAQGKVEQELKEVENRYIQARQNAPVIYQGQGTSNVFMDTFRRLQDELVTVDIERSAVATRLKNVEEGLARAQAEKSLDDFDRLALIDTEQLQRLGTFAGLSASASQTINLATQPLRAQEAETRYSTLTQLQAELAKLEANFGPGHPEVLNRRRELEMVRKLIEEGAKETQVKMLFDNLTPDVLLKFYTRSLRSELATLDQRKIELTTMAQKAEMESKQLIEFELKDRMLNAEIQRKQQLFDGIVDQLRNLDTATGLSGYTHEVLESPRLGEPVWPDLKICAAAGILLGLVLGAALAIISDQIDTRFRSPAEIDAAIGVPVIGQVGRIRRSRDNKRKGRMIVDAQAPEAESFRLLRTYLLRDVKAGNLRTVMVTSCQTKDGKSTILSNLGASFAELGLRTLIMDGDMRAPTIQRFFDMAINEGLSELLQHKVQLDDVIRPTGIDGLSVISAGSAVRNPAELLQSEVFDDLIMALKDRFDLVLVDSGPVLWVSDPAIVSQKCDAALLVIRSSTDTKRKVIEAAKRLRASNANLRGCVVNTYGSGKEFATDSGYSSSYYYSYGYGYGYGHGYGYGGYGRRFKEKENGASEKVGSNGSSGTAAGKNGSDTQAS